MSTRRNTPVRPVVGEMARLAVPLERRKLAHSAIDRISSRLLQFKIGSDFRTRLKNYSIYSPFVYYFKFPLSVGMSWGAIVAAVGPLLCHAPTYLSPLPLPVSALS